MKNKINLSDYSEEQQEMYQICRSTLMPEVERKKKIKIIRRMVEMVKKDIRLSGKYYNKYLTEEQMNEYRCFTFHCPCCSKSFGESIEVKSKSKISTFQIYDSFLTKRSNRNFREHLERRVRMSLCPIHLKLMYKLYGKELTSKLIRRWGEKNIYIGKALILMSRELANPNPRIQKA